LTKPTCVGWDVAVIDLGLVRVRVLVRGVRVLIGGEYLRVVPRLIASARDRVLVGMFVATLGDAARALLDSVATSRARRRVVALEREVFGRVLDTNIEVGRYLAERGIEVVYLSGGGTQHFKLVVADDWVVVGSHNWTDAALTSNDEVSLAIKSKKAANELDKYLTKVIQRFKYAEKEEEKHRARK